MKTKTLHLVQKICTVALTLVFGFSYTGSGVLLVLCAAWIVVTATRKRKKA